MPNKTVIPLALILMLILAACGSQQPAAPPAAAASVSQPVEELDPAGDTAVMQDDNDETMDESSSQDMAVTDDNQDQDMDESQEAMDDGHDQDMGDNAAMDDTHDDADMAMESDDETTEPEAMMELPVWQTLAITNAATSESFTLADFQGKTVFVEPMATWCSNCRTQQFEVQQAKAQLGDDVVFVGLSLETTLPAADLARYAEGNGFDWTYAVMSEELLTGLADEFGRSITSAPSTPHFIIRPDGSFSELSTGIHTAAEIIDQIEAAQS